MPNFNRAIGMAGTGAGIGSAFGGLGAPIGAVAGFLGGLLDNTDPEEERRKRFREYMAALQQIKTRAMDRVSKQNAGLVGAVTQSAAQRAAASGRNAESYILPAQARASKVATENTQNTLGQFDTLEQQANLEFAGRPIQPSVSDYLTQAGGFLAENELNRQYVNAYKNAGMPSQMATDEQASTLDTGIPNATKRKFSYGLQNEYGISPLAYRNPYAATYGR